MSLIAHLSVKIHEKEKKKINGVSNCINLYVMNLSKFVFVSR